MPQQDEGGFEIVNNRFRDAMRRLGHDMTERAITKILISVGSHTAPRIPIMTGTLAASQFRRVWAEPTGYAGEIGYGAEYAAAVHEAPGTLMGTETPRNSARPGWGNVWDPNAEPQFLAKGVEDMIAQDLDRILREEFDL